MEAVKTVTTVKTVEAVKTVTNVKTMEVAV
jgi:hypothetical protein